jgi:hypothetical protein
MRLNSDRSFETAGGRAMPWNRPVAARLLTAVMLASVGCLLLLSSYWVRAEAPRVEATRASREMMQLLRDEHQLVGEMVKAQRAMADGDLVDAKPMAATERRQAIALR